MNEHANELETLLLARIRLVVGYVPIGMKDHLHILKHPDVEALARNYINESQDLQGL